MRLLEAFEFVARQRPQWKAGGHTYAPPFSFNRQHCLRLLGPDKDVRKITRQDLAVMRNTLLTERVSKEGKTRSPGGVNRIMSMLNTLLRDLAECDVIDKAPKLKALREDNTRTEYFTREEIDRLLEAATGVFNNDELAAAITFGVFTGCRQGEMLKLTVADVDLQEGLIFFPETKNGTTHIIDIHPALKPVLEPRVRGCRRDAKVFRFDNKDHLWREFQKVRSYCGISKDKVWHTLRHTTGTWLAEKGVPLQTIARVLNHKQTSTSERYIKLTDKARQSAIHSL